LPLLLAWFAVPLILGAWNALLARYAYAGSDTHLPLRCELWGSLCTALLLISLPFMIGLIGVALAALVGVLVTGLLLMHRQGLLTDLQWARQWLLGLGLLGFAGATLHPLDAGWLQLALGTLVSALAMLALAAWLKPWRA
jgi:peptidoglycan biosynthesis protein MviN/MurJ (putative lipid II flippase)